MHEAALWNLYRDNYFDCMACSIKYNVFEILYEREYSMHEMNAQIMKWVKKKSQCDHQVDPGGLMPG